MRQNQKRREVPQMFRMWGKIWKDNHLLKDTVVENDAKDTRTHKIFQALEEICYDFDLGKPIWLSSNVSEFQRHSKTRFRKDSFIEEIPFDYLEIQVIEEDGFSMIFKIKNRNGSWSSFRFFVRVK